ncbi:MAG: alpha/beta hydrolase [Thermoplasmata archaeon]
MTLNPSMKRILEFMNSINLPDFNKISIEELRRMENQNLGQTETKPVYSISDYYLKNDEKSIKMRFYRIDEKSDSLIIYLHGGGFVFGNLELSDPVAREIANFSKSNVLSIDYRLAPEHKFPAAIDDAYESFLWAYSNYRELGISKEKIVISGDSAGGNLAAAALLKLKDNGKPMPAMQVLFYPVLGPDLASESYREFSENHLLTKKYMDFFAHSYMNDIHDVFNPYFSPLLYPNPEGLPEAIVITAEYDPLRDQGESYVSKLHDAGVEVTGIRALGMIHGFINYTSLSESAENFVRMVWCTVGSKLQF